MQVHQDAYIGIVDILGYNGLEAELNSLGQQTSGALLTRVFQFLDTLTVSKASSNAVNWIRYGDGCVCFADGSVVDNLITMVGDANMLLALALNESIPLRIAITQKTLNVDTPTDGGTISGPGWDTLREIEKSLDWMGGVLYLPNYDGSHQEAIEGMVRERHLVKKQTIAEIQFDPPFKEGHPLNHEKSWFLNWQKILRQPKQVVDASIEAWWSQFCPGGERTTAGDVERKKMNTIVFADYCRALDDAANLIYHSYTHRGVHVG